MSQVKLEPSWMEVLGDEFSKPYIATLRQFLAQEQQQHAVYPPNKDIFSAFWKTPGRCRARRLMSDTPGSAWRNALYTLGTSQRACLLSGQPVSG